MFFRIYFPSLPEPISEVWGFFRSYLSLNNCLPPRWNIRTKVVGKEACLGAENVQEFIESEELPRLNLESSDQNCRSMGLRLNPIAKRPAEPSEAERNSFLLLFYCDDDVTIPSTWSGLIESVCRRWRTYGGFQYNAHYYHWQNCSELNESYIRHFGDPPPTMKRRALPNPPPANPKQPERIILQILDNPGRNIHERGMFRCVASELWLGDSFFDCAPCSRDDILAAKFLSNVRNEPGFIYICAWPTAFTRPDGEQGEIQKALWKLLFQENCAWPPGLDAVQSKMAE